VSGRNCERGEEEGASCCQQLSIILIILEGDSFRAVPACGSTRSIAALVSTNRGLNTYETSGGVVNIQKCRSVPIIKEHLTVYVVYSTAFRPLDSRIAAHDLQNVCACKIIIALC